MNDTNSHHCYQPDAESSSSSAPSFQVPMAVPADHQATKPFACEIEVTFPTNLQSEQAMKVLQVDVEPTDRVTKTFRLKKDGGDDGDDDDDVVAMVV
jgi:hypothetical protein